MHDWFWHCAVGYSGARRDVDGRPLPGGPTLRAPSPPSPWWRFWRRCIRSATGSTRAGGGGYCTLVENVLLTQPLRKTEKLIYYRIWLHIFFLDFTFKHFSKNTLYVYKYKILSICTYKALLSLGSEPRDLNYIFSVLLNLVSY